MYRKQFLTTVKSDESNRHKNYTSKIAAKVVKELNQTTASTEQSRIQNIQKDWRKKMGKQCNAWTVYQKYRLAADW
jgi:plasmid maintenance system killer protein